MQASKMDHRNVAKLEQQHAVRSKGMIPTRLGIGIMSFVACSTSFMARANISINILAMVQPPAHANGSAVIMPDYGPRYNWTASQQSALIGAFYYGTIITVLPLGLLIDRYNCTRQMIACSFLLCGLLQFLCPWMADHSVGALITIGVAMGMTQSTVFSSMHKLIANWAPPNEIGKFTLYAQGTSVGTIVGWSLGGCVIELFGWRCAFYMTGGLLLVCMLLWWRVVYNSPAEHPRIEWEEREYIERSLVGVSVGKKSWPPMRQLLTSAPLWSLILMQFGNLWGFFFIVTGAPKFINEVYGFAIASTGLLASLPYVVRSLASIGFAVLADRMHTAGVLSRLNIRRIFSVLSHIIPGCLLFALPYLAGGDRPYVSIAVLCAAFGFNGAVSQSVMANVHDIAPNYASTVLSLANAIGVAGGFLSPILIAHWTAERSTIVEWRPIFAVNGAMFVLPTLLFVWLGSGEVQPWNGHRTTVEVEMTSLTEGQVNENKPADQSTSDVKTPDTK